MSKRALDANLDFDGMAGNGVNRANCGYCGNQSGLTMKENFGNKTFKGNASDSPMAVGPGVTKDKLKQTIATASQGGKINGGAERKCPANPDKIYIK